MVDPSTKATYFFNTVTNQSQWTPPEGFAEVAAAPSSSAAKPQASKVATPPASKPPAPKFTGKVSFGLAAAKPKALKAASAFGDAAGDDEEVPSEQLQEVLRKQAHRAQVRCSCV